MKKHIFKSLILLINESALETSTIEEITQDLLSKKNEGFTIKETDIHQTFDILKTMHWIQDSKHSLDILPCCMIYAKSPGHSQLEDLALYEMSLHYKKKELPLDQYPPFFQRLIQESSLYIDNSINDAYKNYTDHIQAQWNTSVLSETLSVLYTDYVIDHTGPIEYKNLDSNIANFKHKEWILKVMPQRGIPTNRDVSKSLQVFYKDTLMFEFNKTCPICGCHLSKMLIASHIKPFRDCAHLYEAACHDNGLLLCRNHDFLFDQGYLTFDDQGKAIVHNSIQDDVDLYQITDLDPKYMSQQRKLFLDYHRKHIYKK